MSAGSARIRLRLNGEEREFVAGASIADLVAEAAAAARWVAVERNDELVPRARWPETVPCEGDRIEIVRFVQGG